MPATFNVSEAVRKVLEKATIEPRAVILNGGQLDRKLYLEVNKVLTAAGGKWDRKSKAHIFDRDPREALGMAIETGVAKNEKVANQAFYTPPDVARRVVELAQIDRDLSVLEPSAGEGALVEALSAEAERRNVFLTVFTHDIDKVATQKLLTRAERWNVPHTYTRIFIGAPGDFLIVPRGEFDRVVMNPPFTKGQDVDHVMYALGFLKPGGILVAVMPASIVTRRRVKRDKVFHQLIETQFWSRFEDVPEGAFKESGTMVKTVLLKCVATV